VTVSGAIVGAWAMAESLSAAPETTTVGSVEASAEASVLASGPLTAGPPRTRHVAGKLNRTAWRAPAHFEFIINSAPD
jgi:hypothetical protein